MEAKVHDYIMSYGTVALENTPKVFEKLLGGFKAGDPIWDYRPSQDRFSLREALAHVADWNAIYADRLNRTLHESNPELPNCDEGQIAIDNNYAQSDPLANLERFGRTRKDLVDVVKKIKASDWDRMAVRSGIGPVRLDQQLTIIMSHDAYHTKQVIDYLEAN